MAATLREPMADYLIDWREESVTQRSQSMPSGSIPLYGDVP